MEMDGGQLVVEMLKAYGVRYVFGVPGDTGLAFYDALRAAQGEITHVLARDERSAAYMADVYARVSFRPGVCEGPSGAGATYLASGLAEAHASSIPVVALLSDTPLDSEDCNVLTALDQPALFAPVTKWRTLVKDPCRIPAAMRQAFRVATSGRPGAVQLTLPMDVLGKAVATPSLHAEEACRTYPAYRTRPDPASVARAADLLVGARAPVIVAGGGVVTSQAWRELTDLAEALGAPVGTSICGKGAIAEDHPLSLGVVGGNGGRPYANRVVAAADLVLFVGNKTDSVTTSDWTMPPRSSDKIILHLDVDPAEIGRSYPTAVGLVCDARLGLADLTAAVRALVGAQHGPAGLAPLQDPLAPVAEETGRFQPSIPRPSAAFWAEFEAKAAATTRPIKPQRVIQALANLLPADSIVVADAGTPTPFTAAYLRSAAGRRVIIPRGHGGLGYALPGVVGAKLARPEAQVVGLMGDGSFGMSAGELETVARLGLPRAGRGGLPRAGRGGLPRAGRGGLPRAGRGGLPRAERGGLPVTLVLFNNTCFGWIKVSQELFHSGRTFGVDFSDVDYAAIARGFGLDGVRVEDPADVEPALREALASGRPTLLDIVTECETGEMPPVTKFTASFGEQAG
jgi:acetolactate synthase-1/2/3 large subunit